MKSFLDFGLTLSEVLEEIDTDDLVDEVCSRDLKSYHESDLMDKTDSHQESDCEERECDCDDEIAEALGKVQVFPQETIEDEFKIEHLHKIWNKYTSAQFESMLPE